MKISAFILLALTWTFSVSAIVIRHDVDDKKYHAKVSDFPPLITLYEIGVHGTLIHPEWVLTAAHTIFCLDEGSIIKVGDQKVEVAAIYAYPEYKLNGSHDLALIRLKKPVTGIKPAKLYSGDDEKDKVVWFIGVGGTGNGNTGETIDYAANKGQLRKAQNKIEKVNDKDIFFTFDKGSNALPLEGVSGNGDSGGPAFIKEENGYQLLGVSSRADSPNLNVGDYGITEIYTRVSRYIPWIMEMIKATESHRLTNSSQKRFEQPDITENLSAICKEISIK